MNSKSILTGLLISIFLFGFALADGDFRGTVYYNGCSWTSGDEVEVYNVMTPGDKDRYTIYCCDSNYNGHYYTDDYPPGTYVLKVVLAEGSDCIAPALGVQVVHGTQDQFVHLSVRGKKQEQPDGGGDE